MNKLNVTAEQAMTTHSIRYTDWLDPSKTPDSKAFLHQYQMLSWSLTRWFCGISGNLQTLILDHPIPYTNLAVLLQSCPNLKHLRIGCDGDWKNSPPDTVLARVELRKLEVFMASLLHFVHGFVKTSRQLYRDILVSSPSLQVFHGPLDSADLSAINARNPISNVFSKLVALDLSHFTSAALEMLASVDGLELKYLRLGNRDNSSTASEVSDEERSRKALHKLLPKLKKLEMLYISPEIGVTNTTVQLLTDLELNINWAVLYHSYIYTEHHGGGSFRPVLIDPLQPKVLESFRCMLLSKNPDIDLSEIRFVVRYGRTFYVLETLDDGFTFIERDGRGNSHIRVNELYDPRIESRLDIDF